MDSFAGRGVVITGGASGIGYACAREFANRGARLVLADREATTLEQAVTALTADGHEVYGVPCDVRDVEAVNHLADEAFGLLGSVHVVFSNAGVAIDGPLAAMTHDDWHFVLDVDLWGPIHGVEAFLPRLIEQREGGHLLFTASFAGLVPNVGLGAYCVAKYGVVALAEVLSREVRDSGLGVSVLCPMMVGTNLFSTSARARGYDAPDQLIEGDGVLDVAEVARLTAEAVLADRLYVLPHEAARQSVRRRFERIDSTFDTQAAEGWRH